MRRSEHTNLQFRKLLKLQPGLICISDIGCVKPKVPLLDYARISEGWMAEKIPRQKWSISYLWEHFLVPEHRIPIWLGFKFIINGNSLIFHWFYLYFEFMNQSQVQKCCKFLRFFNKNLMGVSINSPKSLIFLRFYDDFELMNQA